MSFEARHFSPKAVLDSIKRRLPEPQSVRLRRFARGSITLHDIHKERERRLGNQEQLYILANHTRMMEHQAPDEDMLAEHTRRISKIEATPDSQILADLQEMAIKKIKPR